MHYTECGEDREVLLMFLHGGGVSGWMWRPQLEKFADSYHCLVPDLPQHGKSNQYTFFSIDEAADECLKLVKRKGREKKVVVVGFSLGAQVVISMLGKKPSLIDAVMINSALVKPVPFAGCLIQLMKHALRLVKWKAFSKVQATYMYLPEDQHEQYYQESRQMTKPAFASVMEENMSFCLPESFRSFQGSMLITVGEKERTMMKASLEEMVHRNENSKGMMIADAGHGFSLQAPDLFNTILKTWIAESLLDTNGEDV
ncbi:alpha/beta fold hydrolase [Alkalicoccus luteus]|uniref:Alpha/beta hydrolase n=1 Tax=Alkalicoccus luteus TaxID=1237094 RepID=A0A969PSA1_9BACI|nr:alpha/beta hydrolase [Alkalicoccus luteus]